MTELVFTRPQFRDQDDEDYLYTTGDIELGSTTAGAESRVRVDSTKTVDWSEQQERDERLGSAVDDKPTGLDDDESDGASGKFAAVEDTTQSNELVLGQLKGTRVSPFVFIWLSKVGSSC